MNIEQQVCSLELAKRLKELGVKQESYFVWVDKFPIFNDELRISSSDELERQKRVSVLSEEAKMLIPAYSSFTVAELGELMKYSTWHIASRPLGDGTWGCSSPNCEGWGEHYADIEADARAKMLIYFIENKLITL